MNINYSVVAAFEKSKDGRKSRGTSQLFNVLLLAVFFIALMGGLAAGVSVYRSVATEQMSSNDLRIESGLLANIVRANDVAYSVHAGEGPEGRSLVLAESVGDNTYEVRIYRFEGNIVQEYSLSGTEYTPARAQTLVNSYSFDFSIDGNLLTVTTDQGAFNVALRSPQGGAT